MANELIVIDKRFLGNIRGRFYLFTRKTNCHFFKCDRRSSVLKKKNYRRHKNTPTVETAIFFGISRRLLISRLSSRWMVKLKNHMCAYVAGFEELSGGRREDRSNE